MSRRIAPALIAALALFASVPANAISLSFECITNNSATDCGIATSQLEVTIDALGGDQARLELSNPGPLAAVYTSVLLDGTILSAVASITNAAGVSFAEVSPGVLPGGVSAPISFTTDLQVSANSPPPGNGVGPGETLIVDFDIADGFAFQDVIDALTDGSLRIGVRVQAFASGGSESLLNVPVPEPHGVLLLGAGLLGLGRLGRPRR